MLLILSSENHLDRQSVVGPPPHRSPATFPIYQPTHQLFSLRKRTQTHTQEHKHVRQLSQNIGNVGETVDVEDGEDELVDTANGVVDGEDGGLHDEEELGHAERVVDEHVVGHDELASHSNTQPRHRLATHKIDREWSVYKSEGPSDELSRISS